MVADRDRAGDGERIVGVRLGGPSRERLWFLSMLFVLPEARAPGSAARCSPRVLPADGDAMARATATDSAQPISNALYASLRDRARGCRCSTCRPAAATRGVCRPLPVRLAPSRSTTIAAGRPDGPAIGALADAVDALDRERRSASPTRMDHALPAQRGPPRLAVPRPGRRAVGYGYAGEAGRLGPVAVRDAAPARPDPRATSSGRRAARRVRDLGRRRRRPGDRAPLLGAGFRIEPLPGPALLGPPVRRLRPLPPDLARASCEPADASRPACLPVARWRW